MEVYPPQKGVQGLSLDLAFEVWVQNNTASIKNATAFLKNRLFRKGCSHQRQAGGNKVIERYDILEFHFSHAVLLDKDF
jgi:hypothetical protein